MLSARKLLNINPQRLFATLKPSNTLELLETRSLIRVSGDDASPYLQGLITNDINHLNAPFRSMYTMFLNTKGRVLYDAIIYTKTDLNTYFIECDSTISSNLQKLLKVYRVRRKIDIADLADEYKVFALFDTDALPKAGPLADCALYADPRVAQLGWRVLATAGRDRVRPAIERLLRRPVAAPGRSFRWWRYAHGVGEGAGDLPPGACFPLECNGDYMHGVSFGKGCYVGQELTARVHHTGVVRKRLMPLFFARAPSAPPAEALVHAGVDLGKVRGVEADVGLALVRFAKAERFAEISVGDGVARTEKPSWWPVEMAKGKMNKAA